MYVLLYNVIDLQCIVLPSNQSFYRPIAGYVHGGGGGGGVPEVDHHRVGQ